MNLIATLTVNIVREALQKENKVWISTRCADEGRRSQARSSNVSRRNSRTRNTSRSPRGTSSLRPWTWATRRWKPGSKTDARNGKSKTCPPWSKVFTQSSVHSWESHENRIFPIAVNAYYRRLIHSLITIAYPPSSLQPLARIFNWRSPICRFTRITQRDCISISEEMVDLTYRGNIVMKSPRIQQRISWNERASRPTVLNLTVWTVGWTRNDSLWSCK